MDENFYLSEQNYIPYSLGKFCFGHFVDQLGFRFALPGSFSKKEFIDHDANRPYVVFDGIDVFLEGLGGHVEWTANVVLFLL